MKKNIIKLVIMIFMFGLYGCAIPGGGEMAEKWKFFGKNKGRY